MGPLQEQFPFVTNIDAFADLNGLFGYLQNFVASSSSCPHAPRLLQRLFDAYETLKLRMQHSGALYGPEQKNYEAKKMITRIKDEEEGEKHEEEMKRKATKQSQQEKAIKEKQAEL